MNSLLRIDFIPAKRISRASAAICLMAAGGCAAAFLDYRSATLEWAETARQGAAARHRLAEREKRQAAPIPADFTPEAIANINRAIAQLNFPWRDLFGIFESTALPTVALLSLEPDSRKRLLRVSAEAKSAEDMAKYLELLMKEPRIAEVTLIKHEINEQDANRPIRFLLEARWRKDA